MNHTGPAVVRPPGFRRGVSSLAIALLASVGAGVVVAPARAARATVPVSQPLVVLLHDHIARTKPDVQARRIETIEARRPLTRVRTLLPVLGRATSRDGRSWVHVRLPGRPSGHKGWIPASHTRSAATEWRIWVKLSSRRVTVYRDGRVDRRFKAVVGKPSTPTPRGQFFVEEALALSSFEAGGPFALATSARSNVFQEFAGGPGQIALHGLANVGGTPGTAVSHGCVRLDAGAMRWLVRRIGPGMPVTITR